MSKCNRTNETNAIGTGPEIETRDEALLTLVRSIADAHRDFLDALEKEDYAGADTACTARDEAIGEAVQVLAMGSPVAAAVLRVIRAHQSLMYEVQPPWPHADEVLFDAIEHASEVLPVEEVLH